MIILRLYEITIRNDNFRDNENLIIIVRVNSITQLSNMVILSYHNLDR